MTTLLLILVVGLPLAWIVAEFRAPTAVRIMLGILSIGIHSFALFSATQTVRRYEKDFLRISFQDMKRLLEGGRSDVVLNAIDSYQAAVTKDTAFSFQSSLVLRDALKRYAAISVPDGRPNSKPHER